ncbi:MAG: hypothetical protein S4CHLAM123_01610 [Chlamydiales bacterium]|nr:hypothetical protein [Chlamydiales bacterium]
MPTPINHSPKNCVPHNCIDFKKWGFTAKNIAKCAAIFLAISAATVTLTTLMICLPHATVGLYFTTWSVVLLSIASLITAVVFHCKKGAEEL